MIILTFIFFGVSWFVVGFAFGQLREPRTVDAKLIEAATCVVEEFVVRGPVGLRISTMSRLSMALQDSKFKKMCSTGGK